MISLKNSAHQLEEGSIADLSADDMRKRLSVIERLNHRFDNLPTIRLTREAFEALPEYSCSEPTGIRHGKRWRRHDGAHDDRCPRECAIWVVCEYRVIKENDDGTVTYQTPWYRPVFQGDPVMGLLGTVTTPEVVDV